MELAAMTADNDDPVEPQALTVAEIMKLGETDPKAADAALQGIKLAREAREAEAPADIENVDDLLDGLELGADEALEEVEHLGELDAAAAYAVEGAIATAEAYEAQDVLDEAGKAQMKLREQIRAAIVKYSGDGVAPDDPLAKEKKKVSNALQKVGRTTADLPPDFWKLPRTAKIPGDRSRENEFYRVFREAEEVRELEKRGRPANYHLLPADGKLRIDANVRQRRHRDKKRKPSSKPTVAPLSLADIAPDMLGIKLREMSRSLDIWACAGSTALARQLRKPEQQRALIRAAAAYARYFNQYSKAPSRSVLAKMLRCTEGQARRRLDVLKSLYAPSGPWATA